MSNATSDLTFGRFATALLDAAHRQLLRALDGLDAGLLYRQPSPDTNSIAWLAWHLSRWKDRYGAILTGEPQVWVSEGWAERFSLGVERTGQGDTLEQVAAFRPDRDLLLGYVQAAHDATVRRVERASPEQLAAPFQYMSSGEPRPAWQAFINTAMDFTQHTGQIAYLRGLLEGKGWRD